jgi:hypothetical protein
MRTAMVRLSAAALFLLCVAPALPIGRLPGVVAALVALTLLPLAVLLVQRRRARRRTRP